MSSSIILNYSIKLKLCIILIVYIFKIIVQNRNNILDAKLGNCFINEGPIAALLVKNYFRILFVGGGDTCLAILRHLVLNF